MDSLDEIIAELKRRPAMYLGGNSIARLSAFLEGWKTARNQPEDTQLLERFQQWVADKYQVTTTQHWDMIIPFFCMDETSALERFFQLYDEFRGCE